MGKEIYFQAYINEHELHILVSITVSQNLNKVFCSHFKFYYHPCICIFH